MTVEKKLNTNIPKGMAKAFNSASDFGHPGALTTEEAGNFFLNSFSMRIILDDLLWTLTILF
jgi:hypothetical protein